MLESEVLREVTQHLLPRRDFSKSAVCFLSVSSTLLNESYSAPLLTERSPEADEVCRADEFPAYHAPTRFNFTLPADTSKAKSSKTSKNVLTGLGCHHRKKNHQGHWDRRFGKICGEVKAHPRFLAGEAVNLPAEKKP